jgi:hypothetical protein
VPFSDAVCAWPAVGAGFNPQYPKMLFALQNDGIGRWWHLFNVLIFVFVSLANKHMVALKVQEPWVLARSWPGLWGVLVWFKFFWWYWGLNLEPHTCWASALSRGYTPGSRS